MNATAPAFCTIASANHAGRIRTLAASLGRHYPEAVLHALMMDADATSRPREIEGNIQWVVPEETTIDPMLFAEMASMYSPLELSCALKPFFVRDLVLGGAPAVVYLDSDTWVLARFDEFIQEAHESGVVLTPHVRHVLPPARAKTDIEGITLKAGLINMGVFAVTRDGLPFLDWLGERLRRESIHDPEGHRNADQRWVDLALTIFPHTLTRDEGVNVGWWSFAGCEPDIGPTGDPLIAGTPIKVLHMSGFDKDQPWILSAHAGSNPHLLLSEAPGLRAACAEYASELQRLRSDDDDRPYGFSALPRGVVMDQRLRRIYREAVWHADRGAQPYPPVPLLDPEGFLDWLGEPTGALCAPAPLSRYLRDVYNASPVLSARFPDIDGTDAEPFLEWCRSGEGAVHGAQVALAPAGVPTPGRPGCTGAMGHKVLIIGEVDRPSVRQDDALPEALASALAAAGTPSVVVEGDRAGAPSPAAREIWRSGALTCPSSIVAAPGSALPMLNHAYLSRDTSIAKRLVFLLWHYDSVDAVLTSNRALLRHALVPSGFSAQALARCADVEAEVVGLALPRRPERVPAAEPAHAAFRLYATVDLDDGGFRSQSDCLIAAVAAVRSEGVHVSLVLGLRGAERWVIEAERWRLEAKRHESVTTVDLGSHHPADDPNLTRADAVISTHATEAFLWTAAAGMAAGVPVVATAYGGNLDYMDESNAWLLEPSSIEAARVGTRAPDGSRYARLDPARVAETIAALVEDRTARDARRIAGLAVADRFSLHAVGQRIVRKLDLMSREDVKRRRIGSLLRARRA